MTTETTKTLGKYPKFAATLRADMDDKNRTVAEVARYLNVSTNSVRKYLAGENLPGPQTLVDLAQFLSVEIDRYLQDSPMAGGGRTRTPAARMVFTRGMPLVGHSPEDYRGPAPVTYTYDGTSVSAPDPVGEALAKRRAEFARDISEMLARYDNIDALRSAYLTVAQALGDHWEASRKRPT